MGDVLWVVMGTIALVLLIVCGNVTNPALNTDDGHVLEAIVSQLNLLEARWSQVESFCDRMPGTLVHGDFVGKNMNIRTSPDGLALYASGCCTVCTALAAAGFSWGCCSSAA